MKTIILILLSSISILVNAQDKEIPKELFKDYWNCNYAVDNAIPGMDVMEICDSIIAEVWKNYFHRDGEIMMKWHNQHKDIQYSIRKELLVPRQKQKLAL